MKHMTKEIAGIVAKLRRQDRSEPKENDLCTQTECGSWVDITKCDGSASFRIPFWSISVNCKIIAKDGGFKTRTEAIDFIREQKTMIKLLTFRSF